MRLKDPREHCRGSEPCGSCATQEAGRPNGETDGSAEGGEAESHMQERLIWYQCETHVKGICTGSQGISVNDFL